MLGGGLQSVGRISCARSIGASRAIGSEAEAEAEAEAEDVELRPGRRLRILCARQTPGK